MSSTNILKNGSYQDKYLKYKLKYNLLKKQLGGKPSYDDFPDTYLQNICSNYLSYFTSISEFDDFIKYLYSSNKYKLPNIQNFYNNSVNNRNTLLAKLQLNKQNTINDKIRNIQ